MKSIDERVDQLLSQGLLFDAANSAQDQSVLLAIVGIKLSFYINLFS